MMKKAAVICASGIGDALMMMISAFALYKHHYEITFYHGLIGELKEWFFPITFKPQSLLQNEHELIGYDLIILQNDNSEKAKQVIDRFYDKNTLSIFYPSYEKTKHRVITVRDFVFDGNIPMTHNICFSMQKLLDDPTLTTDNGITPFSHLSHRNHLKRVIIHPTSTVKIRTWTQKKFLDLAKKLFKSGLEPVLTVSREEYPEWEPFTNNGTYQIKFFNTLSDLSSFIYESGYFIGNESGLSHLSSNLLIPNIVIAGSAKRIKLWRPGWKMGSIITPPVWVPNIKGFRLRENSWQFFISSSAVLRSFIHLYSTN